MISRIQGIAKHYQDYAFHVSIFSAYDNAISKINDIANRMWDGVATDQEWQDWLDISMFIEKMDPIVYCYLALTNQDIEKAEDLAAQHAKAHSQKWGHLFDELEKAGFYQAHEAEEIEIFEEVIKQVFKYKTRKKRSKK